MNCDKVTKYNIVIIIIIAVNQKLYNLNIEKESEIMK